MAYSPLYPQPSYSPQPGYSPHPVHYQPQQHMYSPQLPNKHSQPATHPHGTIFQETQQGYPQNIRYPQNYPQQQNFNSSQPGPNTIASQMVMKPIPYNYNGSNAKVLLVNKKPAE